MAFAGKLQYLVELSQSYILYLESSFPWKIIVMKFDLSSLYI